MKNIIYTFFVVVGFSTMSFAQEANEIAMTAGKTELANSKANGVYHFTLVDQTAEDIEKSASYYTNYFTVDYNESSKAATITMKESENSAKGRSVIMRFLTSAGARYVNIDGQVITTSEFMVDYLQ